MDEHEESCNTQLDLGLSISQYVPKRKHQNDLENNNDENNDGYSRKKLKLTKAQTNLLEDTFKSHTTLNSDQKHALAEKLDLQPRQVEVWFQNKRARTKLKKTEVECEFLDKCCKSLSEENQRLKKEVQRLKVLKQLSYIQLLPKATTMLKLCATCENNNMRDGEAKPVSVSDVVQQCQYIDNRV